MCFPFFAPKVVAGCKKIDCIFVCFWNFCLQLDIEVVFNKPDLSNENEGKEQTFGPFGLLVLADLEHLEQSALYFYISYRKDKGWTTEFVSDPKR